MRNHHNTILRERIVLILLLMILAGVVGWLIGNSQAEEPAWDVEYPMTNVNVSWLQSHHSGAWSE